MTFKVNIEMEREFVVAADIDTVFALLSDVPASAAHFPKVKALTALSNNSFKWDMEEVTLGIYSIQTSYACQYVSDKKAKTVVWTPIKGEGNAEVSGHWELTQLEAGTNISFKTKAELTLQINGFLKLAVSPLVKFEFTGMVDTYLRNLKDLWA
jgi:carbon monoxide dehydrogenase subunit G